MEKQLSIGGKEILLKVVAQAIHVFAMSDFVYQKVFARKSQILLLFSGGEMMRKIRKCIGILGGNYVTQRVKVVLASEIYTRLIWHC